MWSLGHQVLQGRVALGIPTPLRFRTNRVFGSHENTIATFNVAHLQVNRKVLLDAGAGIRLGRSVGLQESVKIVAAANILKVDKTSLVHFLDELVVGRQGQNVLP